MSLKINNLKNWISVRRIKTGITENPNYSKLNNFQPPLIEFYSLSRISLGVTFIFLCYIFGRIVDYEKKHVHRGKLNLDISIFAVATVITA